MVSDSARVRVIAAVVERQGRFLVGQRPPGHRHAGLWEFPGGKVEPGESDLQAAQRELDEELQVRVLTVGEILAEHDDPGTPFTIVFRRARIDGQPMALEHAALAWPTLSELSRLPMAPSDARFVAELQLN